MRVATKNAWQNLGLVTLTSLTLAAVVWLLTFWPPAPPQVHLAAAPLPVERAEPVAAFLGDSYTEGTGASSSSHRWTTLVANRMGWREANFGQGGTGYSTAGPVPGRQPYPARADDINADVIVVAGGQNDYGHPMPKILAGIRSTFTTLRRHNPHARIIAVSPTGPTKGDVAPELVRMRDVIQRMSRRVDAEFVDATTPNWMNASDVLAADGMHPNDRGHARYARLLVAALR